MSCAVVCCVIKKKKLYNIVFNKITLMTTSGRGGEAKKCHTATSSKEHTQ
jgi:hypothetical protein